MEKIRIKFGRFSSRVLNRSRAKETPETKERADFNFLTDFEEENCSIIWRIENIHRCPLKLGEFFESPDFSLVFFDGIRWTLKIYPKGKKSEDEELLELKQWQSDEPFNQPDESNDISTRLNKTVGLYITRITSNPITSSFNCRVSFELEFQNSKETVLCPSKSVINIKMDSASPSECGTDDLFSAPCGVLGLAQTLTIRCYFYATKYNNGANGHFMPGPSKSSLYQDLKETYESGKFSDITLQAGGVQFPAHKVILVSRSEVFEAMFKHNMKETQNNVVEIEDVEPEILGSMLQYIYTGSVEDFSIEKALDLYPVADRYLLEELKKWCTNLMLRNLAVENVCQIAVLADLHPDSMLKRATLNTFRKYTGDIFKRQEWQDLIQDSDRRALVSSILQAVSADFTTRFP